MATIHEALQNAEYNLVNNRGSAIAFEIGKSQLHNAIVLLEKGYGLYAEVEPLLHGVGTVHDVPKNSP